MLVSQEDLGNGEKQSHSKLMKYVLISTGKLLKPVKCDVRWQSAYGVEMVKFQFSPS